VDGLGVGQDRLPGREIRRAHVVDSQPFRTWRTRVNVTFEHPLRAFLRCVPVPVARHEGWLGTHASETVASDMLTSRIGRTIASAPVMSATPCATGA
jgi:hypothetical protein